MRSTMQHSPLLISHILRHGQQVHGRRSVITVDGNSYRTASFAEVAARAERLAAALERLGVRRGDRVATFGWNNQWHLEAYLAVPCMGAVLHTLNIRLCVGQLGFVMDHAEDRIVIVDASLVPLLTRVPDPLERIETVIVVGGGADTSVPGDDTSVPGDDTSVLGDNVLSYEELLAAEQPGFDWPELEERDAAAMCYTSGTTGNPKGVVYSHRSTFLHSFAQAAGGAVGMDETDRVLIVVPMFHANAWGLPYAAWLTGADQVLPQQYLQGEHLVRIMRDLQPTLACGVPTIWNDVLRVAREEKEDLSFLRHLVAGGSAVPRAMMEAFESEFGVPILQGWGMTETSPLAALARPPAGSSPEEELDYRARTGRVVPGVELRIAGEGGRILPVDGRSVGELEVRGPWVTASYYKDPGLEHFHDGWLRTGDVGTLDEQGFLQITDRTKDIIKSGGEWISSVELENEVMAHPDVFEAAVVAVPDARWQERPLVCVVPEPGTSPSAQELVEFLDERVARWWLPERWTFLDALPKTSVGKFDKKVLRASHAAGDFEVVTVDLPPAR